MEIVVYKHKLNVRYYSQASNISWKLSLKMANRSDVRYTIWKNGKWGMVIINVFAAPPYQYGIYCMLAGIRLCLMILMILYLMKMEILDQTCDAFCYVIFNAISHLLLFTVIEAIEDNK